MIDVAQRRAADTWFLDRGLPTVLRPGALVRRLWPRSAPALAAFAVFMANSALVVLITVDEPHGAIWGGVVAAPAFQEIARFALQYLEIPPDA